MLEEAKTGRADKPVKARFILTPALRRVTSGERVLDNLPASGCNVLWF